MSDFKAKMHQIRLRLGIRPRLRWGAYSASPDFVAGFRGLLLRRGREKEGGKGRRRGRKGEGEEKERGRGWQEKGKEREERKHHFHQFLVSPWSAMNK